MAELVPLAEIRAAARRLEGVAVRTPLLPVPALTSANVLIKPESLQPTGAFKLRGAYNAIAALAGESGSGDGKSGAGKAGSGKDKPEQAGVVTHSSGNHGFAVAYAAARLGVRAAIVVPHNAPEVKTAAIERAGGELIRVEPTLDARLEGCNKIAHERGYAVVPPFDHPLVIAGQGTIGLEIVDDLAQQKTKPSAVLVPVSGGGLISGIAIAVKAAFPDTRVIGVEPELAADARESLRTGTRVRWASSDVARTRADALRVEQVGELTFAHMRELVSDIVTVAEDEITGAIRRLARNARLVAEPGGAVSVAAALNRTPAELGISGNEQAPVVAVLSGGNIDPKLLAEILSA